MVCRFETSRRMLAKGNSTGLACAQEFRDGTYAAAVRQKVTCTLNGMAGPRGRSVHNGGKVMVVAVFIAVAVAESLWAWRADLLDSSPELQVRVIVALAVPLLALTWGAWTSSLGRRP